MKPIYIFTLCAVLTACLAGPIFAVSYPVPKSPASVYLNYSVPPGTIFFNTVCIQLSQTGSFFAVCGFSQGYYGLQELANGQHVLIFSAWDSHQQKAKTLFLAPGIHVTKFGGEGTGVHIICNFNWQLRQTYKFAVIANQIGNRTTYAAWLFLAEQGIWKHLATFSTGSGPSPGLITGYYSFIEDFRGDTISNHEVRDAMFGPGWIWTKSHSWQQINRAIFSHTHAPWEDQKDVDGGAVGDHFYLQNGGNTQTHNKSGSHLTIPAAPAFVKSLLKVVSPDVQ